MADVIFAIVAVLMTLGGIAGALLIVFAAAMGSATNMSAAAKTIRWALVPAAIAALGVYFCFQAF